jgi:hypothetical protein
MGKVMPKPTLSDIEDQWQRQATAAAIEAARKIATGGTIPPGAPIGRLSDSEWGWLFAAMLFAWLSSRAEQATSEGRDVEAVIRESNTDAWDAGAIVTVLPELAAVDIDWTLPLNDWPRETMVGFLTTAFTLIRHALAARDLGGGVTQEKGADRIAREANAAAGNPLVVPSEMNDPLPF